MILKFNIMKRLKDSGCKFAQNNCNKLQRFELWAGLGAGLRTELVFFFFFFYFFLVASCVILLK